MTDDSQLPLGFPGKDVKEVKYTPLVFEKTIRIAVSDDVRVTKTELDIINTPEFQRLRWIRQLGSSVLVYPTALHTRFDHSLGVLKMVDEMIVSIRDTRFQVDAVAISGEENSLDITDDQRKIARLYALLHDITHVPFGHTLEDELHIFPSHDGFQKNPGDTASLYRFEHFLGESSTIGKIIIQQLDKELYGRFRDVFLKGKMNKLPSKDGSDEFIYFLVSDTVCADLLDYVRRDAYFANIEFDLSYRFLNFLYIGEDGEHGRRVVVRLWKPKRHEPRRDLLTDLSSLLEARYKVAERIYCHPAKIIAGTLLGRAVLEAKLAGNLTEQQMLDHSDDSLLHHLRYQNVKQQDNASKKNAQLSKRLATLYAERRLYKMEKYIKEDFIARNEHDSDLREVALSRLRDPIERKTIEDDIAELAGVEPGDVLIYPASLKMNSKVAEVLVRWRGKKVTLAQIDDPILKPKLELTQDAHAALWFIGLMFPRTLLPEQIFRVKSAFEAYFLPQYDRKQKFVPLVQFLAANDESLQGLAPRRFNEGCLGIAGKLADETAVAHKGLSTREYIAALIKAEFDNDGNNGAAAKVQERPV